MPTLNHKIMIALDWLTLSLESDEPLLAIDNCDEFVFHLRGFGSKQFRSIYDVEILDKDGIYEPFGVFLCEPTVATWSPCVCHLKLDNHLLYRGGGDYWQNALSRFMQQYKLMGGAIVRCDLAGDFLYLRNRISGPQLAQRIKSCQWWKCGSVNISEHYTLPYTLDWQKESAAEGFTTEVFLQGGEFSPRVETLTFGTMSSAAQVCLYDKTRDLNRSAVSVSSDPKAPKESAKEYIRDCHKQAGVYDPVRHTWRIEFRLRSKAAFITDAATMAERPLMIEDLSREHIFQTFKAAADRYFRIVDATQGDSVKLTADYVARMHKHKNRLPIINLFPTAPMTISFTTRKYHIPANQFNRSVVRRVAELGYRASQIQCPGTLKGDADILSRMQQLLSRVAASQSSSHSGFLSLLKQFESNLLQAISSATKLTEDDCKTLSDCRNLLERHLHFESPVFTTNISNSLLKLADRMTLSPGAHRKAHLVRTARPSDAQILLDAAAVLRSVYSESAFDERAADQQSIYEAKYRELIRRYADGCELLPSDIQFLRYCRGKDSPIPCSRRFMIDDGNYGTIFEGLERIMQDQEYLESQLHTFGRK